MRGCQCITIISHIDLIAHRGTMKSNTLTAIALLALLVSTLALPLPAPEAPAEATPADRQIGSLLLGLLTPVITNLFTSGASNLASGLFNAFTATMAGQKLELIPLEALLATPIREGETPDPASGEEPSRRRYYARTLLLDDQQPLEGVPEVGNPTAAEEKAL